MAAGRAGAGDSVLAGHPGGERLQMPVRPEEIHRLLGEATGRRAAGGDARVIRAVGG